jgi:putative flippase GtrA
LLLGLVTLLLVSYVATGFGSPPPNVTAIVIAEIAGTALAVVWAYWVDRHRVVVTHR